jgi:uncharacterized protein YggE
MNENNFKTNAWKTASMLGIALTIYALVAAYGEYKSWSNPAIQGATITVSGVGEATAIPDIATITFTIRETAKTVPEAQKLVEAKAKPALDALTKLGVASKDIKTLSYIVNPKYEYETTICPMSASYCQPKQKLVGYEVSQTTQVKVRKIDSAGEAIAIVGENKISEVSGPAFEVDDIEKIKAEAKEAAIKDARSKAKSTAGSLGVDLGRITGFSEDGGYNPVPMYARAEMKTFAAGAADSLQTVSLPQGESVIKVNVSITYELK